MAPDGANADHISQAPDEAARLRALGFNIIPVRPGTKMPRADEGDMAKWKSSGCDAEIRDTDNIAMLHGSAGGTWALDLDDPMILDDILKIFGKLAKTKMCVVRTPGRGHHILFKRVDDGPPPGDLRYRDARGREIDVKSVGYTLLPPSTYIDQSSDRYEYIGTNQPNLEARWDDIQDKIDKLGFSRISQTA